MKARALVEVRYLVAVVGVLVLAGLKVLDGAAVVALLTAFVIGRREAPPADAPQVVASHGDRGEERERDDDDDGPPRASRPTLNPAPPRRSRVSDNPAPGRRGYGDRVRAFVASVVVALLPFASMVSPDRSGEERTA